MEEFSLREEPGPNCPLWWLKATFIPASEGRGRRSRGGDGVVIELDGVELYFTKASVLRPV